MEVKIVKIGKKSRDFGVLQVGDSCTLGDLKNQFQELHIIHHHRQFFKLRNEDNLKPLVDDEKTLKVLGVQNGSELVFKDLGPQIGYRTVFVLEYLGPLLILWMYSSRPSWIYGDQSTSKSFNRAAFLGTLCWNIHFIKRELESLFVHRFSLATMPFINLFKNCAYYWCFAAVIGYPLCHPLYQSPSNQHQIHFGLFLFLISELLNFAVHLQFRFMRPKDGCHKRPIPKGPLFALVSCPNYTFEVLGWVGFSIMTQLFFSYVFTLAGLFLMTQWALKKHHNYIKTYGMEYKILGRRAIIPLVV